jgi:hypothetical protein
VQATEGQPTPFALPRAPALRSTWRSDFRDLERDFVTTWRVVQEDEGIGGGASDTFQDEAVQVPLCNQANVQRPRGFREEHDLARIQAVLEEQGRECHVIAFMHVAAGNLQAETILHTLHTKTRGKQTCMLCDEFSMVPRQRHPRPDALIRWQQKEANSRTELHKFYECHRAPGITARLTAEGKSLLKEHKLNAATFMRL